MGFASTETLLPIDQWARVMQLNPWWFNQWGRGLPKPDTANCPHVFFQFSWQQDFMSRELIAETISAAENVIAQHLDYWPAPKYILDEPVQFPRPANRSMAPYGYTNQGRRKAVNLDWKKVQGGGVLGRTEINAAAAVNRSDPDGDGLPELFTVAVATTVTNPDEIGIYFTDSDRNNEPIAETWRIRPVRVTISGGIATIKGHASMLAVPDEQLKYTAAKAGLDASNAANYVTTVAVYRVYRDDSYDVDAGTSRQGYAMWESGCDTPPCSSDAGPVCIGPRDPEIGYVWVDYDLGNCFNRAPDRLSISYLAGQPLENGQMNKALADAVARLATAMLPVEKCGCEQTERIMAYWRETGPAPGEGLRETLTGVGDNGTPFGAQRGARYAWNVVKMLRKLP